nr:neuraminidase-like domain-containing protein [Kribbella solani]
MQALRTQGFTSASAVVAYGPDEFADKLAGDVDVDEARRIHSRAVQVHAAAVNLVTDLRSAGQIDVPWLAPLQPLTDQIPNWEELFGSTDYCACAECRSLYSQAAYLADLLTFLRELGIDYGYPRGGEGFAEAQGDPLSSRRHDLWELKLSCDNTNLQLPYVDLVNELLETAVSPTTAVPAADRQTSGDPGQLRVRPQHVNAGAYATLRTAVYPWGLPFDLWRLQIGTALDQLGVPREALLRATSAPGADSALVVEEVLGLTKVAAQIVSGEALTPARTLPEFWGFPADTTPDSLIEDLLPVRAVLYRSGLNYADLVAVLETRFVNLQITVDPADPCNTAGMRIAQLTTDALDRMHRFVRLQRALGWLPSELDRAIAALGGGTLNRTTLAQLAAVRRLAERLDLPLERVLVLIGRFDGFTYPSVDQLPLYDRLFLDPTVVVTQPGVANPFALNATRTEVAVNGPLLDSTVTAGLLAVLQVTDEELLLLVNGPRSVTPDRTVTLDNLSALVRTVTLAKALGLSVADLLRLMELSGLTLQSVTLQTPAEAELMGGQLMRFPTPPPPVLRDQHESELQAGALPRFSAPPVTSAAAIPVDVALDRLSRLADAVQELSAFGIGDLDTILAGSLTGVPDDGQLELTLTALRAALQDVYQETAQSDDDQGDLTRKNLGLLGWDAAAVDDALATLRGTTVYQEPLATLPTAIPAGLPVRYDPVDLQLICTGPMTDADRQQLEGLSADAAYRAAILALWDAPRDAVASRMKALRPPTYATRLTALPGDLDLPKPMAGRVYYDATTGSLCCRGFLSAADAEILSAASNDPAFKVAVADLRRLQLETPIADGNQFFTRAEADALFATDLGAAGRFRIVQAKLGPVVRKLLTETAVKQHLGTATGLDAATVEALLGTWLPTVPIATFLAPEYVGSDPAVPVIRSGFPAQYVALTQLHRVALLLTRAGIGARDLPLSCGYVSAGWLDLNTLPRADVAGASPLFGPLLRLLALLRLRTAVPTVGAVFAAVGTAGSTVASVLAALSTETGWNLDDVTVLAGLLGLDQVAEFADERNLLALTGAVRVIQRLGVSATRAGAWLAAEPTAQAGEAAWQAAKAKYALPDWPAVGGPLQDKLRELQRSALLSYLVANPIMVDGAPAWSDEIGVHNYFLLDVEMGPCQQTTRLAQAIYSVQLFIERCRLHLEPTADDGSRYAWPRWEWMQEYRLWEANQKIFLYPENYTEPELRAGKSPFFVDVENELLQGEVTNDAVEATFLNYLEQLNGVARLQPCGMYSYYNEKLFETTLYVFARTESTPRQYYFRQFTYDGQELQYGIGEWTPWQHIELDIEGETLVPVVWNERLYIFWLSFVEVAEPQPIKFPPDNGVIPLPDKHWEIKLNWSQYVNGQWQAKKISQQVLSTAIPPYQEVIGPFVYPLTPPEDAKRKDLYVCRPAIDPTSGDLVIWCMLNGTWDYSFTFPISITFTKGVAGGFQLSSRRGTVSVAPLTLRPPGDIPPIVPVPTNTYTQNNEFVERPDGDGKLWLPSQEDPLTMLRRMDRTPGATPFRVLYPHQYFRNWENLAMFFTDATRTYLVEPFKYYQPDPGTERPLPALARALASGRTPIAAAAPPALLTGPPPAVPPGAALQPPVSGTLVVPGPAPASDLGAVVPAASDGWEFLMAKFVRFYHPHVELFIGTLTNFGLEALFDPVLQADPESFLPVRFNFGSEPDSVYAANAGAVAQPYPDEPVAFEDDDAYATYNWELFFHIPLMIAERLSANQRFEEAQQWFHRIFDPTATAGTGPQRYWRTKPFAQKTDPDYQKERIEKILAALGTGDTEAEQAVFNWIDNPFQPDAVARLRTTAYQKAVVMKYLDNLIAWGDQLFRRDTMESINQATQLYLLASELLGRRPEEVTDRAEPAPKSYLELVSTPGQDAVTLAEHLVPMPGGSVHPTITPTTGSGYLNYFRLPRNEKLLGYWDTVADRLFKIRHCQNIDGTERPAALFGPPIDPGLLVRAAAAGVDLSTVLDDINAPLPHYRFSTMLAKAKELAAEVKSFGSTLLTALEKRDAEVLARLRSTQELAVLRAVRDVKQQQVDEAAAALEATVRSKATAEAKQKYYQDKKLTNDKEDAHQRLTMETFGNLEIARTINMIASVISALPDAKLGTPTTIGVTWGSSNIIAGLRGISEAHVAGVGMKQGRAQLSATLGGYDHRFEDWQFQAAQAGLEANQLEQQIQTGIIKLQIAQHELANQDLQISNAKATDELLHAKFTNQELYDWMAGQISTTYFQAYQLAYDVAKRAERSYRHELGVDDSNFVKFGYWDSLHKGLLAGEKLATDLGRMDAAYCEANAREFELSKRISIAQLDPDALQSLKQTGRCFVSLPEALFDLDTPGHFRRRIKSLSITVPCVAGPYTGVNLTATLLRSSIRVDPRTGDYPRKQNDPRFRDAAGSVESIVTSAGQEDAGLFETNLRDERYLPFEGAGVISEWELSLPDKFRQFDYESITDVVLHLRYTARQGGSGLGADAVGQLTDALDRWVHAGGGQGMFRGFSVRREFADQWSRFLQPAGSSDPQVTLTLSKDRFPYLFRDHRLTVDKPTVVLVLSRAAVGVYRTATALQVQASTPSGPDGATLSPGPDGQPQGRLTKVNAEITETAADWVLSIPRTVIAQLPESLRTTDNLLQPGVVEDLLLVCHYTVAEIGTDG